MQANRDFESVPKSFWADIRTISQKTNYTKRVSGKSLIKVPTAEEIQIAYKKIGLKSDKILDENLNLTSYGSKIIDYYDYRAKILNDYVEPRLMDAVLLKKSGKILNEHVEKHNRAELEYNKLYAELTPKCPIPMNKQKGDKQKISFFTGIINMIIEKHIEGLSCDYDPRELTTFTENGYPLRTLSRRVDGAFPSIVNPVAMWEIKEYYYTTTFGSRVADGVYETLLDGMELEEMNVNTNRKAKHYLMIDSHYTWWTCGKSYLCRIIDMLNMGYLDEVLFGYEVIERLPDIVESWKKQYKTHNQCN